MCLNVPAQQDVSEVDIGKGMVIDSIYQEEEVLLQSLERAMRMSTSATAKTPKQFITSIGAGLAVLAIINLALYIPIWHHQMLGIVIIFALAGNRLVLKTKSHGFRRAFMGFLCATLMVVGLWEHMWFIIIIAGIFSIGLAVKDFIEE